MFPTSRCLHPTHSLYNIQIHLALILKLLSPPLSLLIVVRKLVSYLKAVKAGVVLTVLSSHV